MVSDSRVLQFTHVHADRPVAVRASSIDAVSLREEVVADDNGHAKDVVMDTAVIILSSGAFVNVRESVMEVIARWQAH